MTKKEKRISQAISEIKRISDLSDCSKEHILKLIGEDFYCGEVHETIEDEEIYGWWKIGNGKIEIEMCNPY